MTGIGTADKHWPYIISHHTVYLYIIIIIASIALILAPMYVPYQGFVTLSYGLSYAMASLGLNLLLGYAGLLSFGHGVFFAIGAYTVALIARYAPNMYSLEVIIPLSIISSGLFAALVGYICARVAAAYFAILNLAISMVIYSLIFKFYGITRGSDGLPVPPPMILGRSTTFAGFDYIINIFYYILAMIFIVSTIILYLMIVSSPFGKAIQATRDNPDRAYLLGINVRNYRYYAYIISGIYTGLGGAMWSIVNGYVSPEIAHWTFSGEIVFMTLLGGYTIFIGPIIGALIYAYIKLYAAIYTQYWLFTLGALILMFSLVFPKGIAGSLVSFYQMIVRVRVKSVAIENSGGE